MEDIESLVMIEGMLPRMAGMLAVEWAKLHKEALRRIWEMQELIGLPPLE